MENDCFRRCVSDVYEVLVALQVTNPKYSDLIRDIRGMKCAGCLDNDDWAAIASDHCQVAVGED